MITGAWRAARHERIRLSKINGNGSKARVARRTTLIAIQSTITTPNVMMNLQLPPNDAILSDNRSPKVSFVSNCSAMLLARISCCCKLSMTSLSSADSSPSSSSSTSLTYSFRNLPRSSKQIKPFPSQFGRLFLMNSRSDGRINSASIPSCGNFGFVQISQISVAGAVLFIGSRSQLKLLLLVCRFRLESAIVDHNVPCMEEAEVLLEDLHERVRESAE